MLHRTLEPKTKWEKYFPKSQCKPVSLGKGDTGYGIDKMVEWAKKYAWQTKDLAKALQGKTLEETLKNVHWFAYKNFQYKPDHYEQHLESPACAWQKRAEGMNCKGYSIIISSILQNLDIPHTFRRVSYRPGEFSHVFVVVPAGHREYILDATLPQFNYTPPYQKHDDRPVITGQTAMNQPETTKKRNVMPVLMGLIATIILLKS